MKLTKKQKIVLGVAVVTGAGLLAYKKFASPNPNNIMAIVKASSWTNKHNKPANTSHIESVSADGTINYIGGKWRGKLIDENTISWVNIDGSTDTWTKNASVSGLGNYALSQPSDMLY